MSLPTLTTERKTKPRQLQSIKIIAEIVVNMNIVARRNISSKLKNSTSEIGYYSYTLLAIISPLKKITLIAKVKNLIINK